MGLSEYDGKYVRIMDTFGETFTGIADYCDYDYLTCEFGGREDGIRIGGFILYRSQIAYIRETELRGTAELWTDRLILRRFREDDAQEP